MTFRVLCGLLELTFRLTSELRKIYPGTIDCTEPIFPDKLLIIKFFKTHLKTSLRARMLTKLVDIERGGKFSEELYNSLA